MHFNHPQHFTMVAIKVALLSLLVMHINCELVYAQSKETKLGKQSTQSSSQKITDDASCVSAYGPGWVAAFTNSSEKVCVLPKGCSIGVKGDEFFCQQPGRTDEKLEYRSFPSL